MGPHMVLTLIPRIPGQTDGELAQLHACAQLQPADKTHDNDSQQ